MKTTRLEFEAFADVDMLGTALVRMFEIRGSADHLNRLDSLIDSYDEGEPIKQSLVCIREELCKYLKAEGRL